MTINNHFDIYEYFNSRDIAEHCRRINHTFSAIETAYVVWRSNHHTLDEKQKAWKEIINTMPDECFPPNWDFDEHTLHSFLQTYMRVQNEYIQDFCASSNKYIYTYEICSCSDSERYNLDANMFFNSYEACFTSLQDLNDSNTYDEAVKIKIFRCPLHSSVIAYGEGEENEAIVFDTQLKIFDIEPAGDGDDEDGKFINYPNGFYEMWVAIPTPFQKGDIVTDIDSYDSYLKKHKPLLLQRLPYWERNANNGDNCDGRIKRMLEMGVDWTDMQVGYWYQDDTGEIYWDHGYFYLDLEYYRDDLFGTEKFLQAVSNCIQNKISLEELLVSHSVILMENYAQEMRRNLGQNEELMRLCGLE